MNETEKSSDVTNENSDELLMTTSTAEAQQSVLSPAQTDAAHAEDTLSSSKEQNEIESHVNVDTSNIDIENQLIQEMIQLINNNQRDTFVEINKYKDSQIHNLINENRFDAR